ncbi:MAG: DUF3450 domain-containing protein [Gammaproteobacteria bacterium]|nr:DUF3450 domain-containing protein [Gammaproteobacteria bacterium]
MHRHIKTRKPLLLIPLLCWCFNASADPVDDILSGEKATIQQAAQSQQRINSISDATQQAFADYQLELKRIEDLQVYNLQMEKQIERQQESIITTEQSIQDVAIIERQVSPLLARMIDSLDAFIKLDLPFQQEERAERVQFLKNTLERSDVSAAEKFRQVLDAYAIEVEYGNTIEAWRGTLTLADKPREVEFLRIGRIALMYQTLDGAGLGVWNARQHGWEELDGRYRKDFRLGLKIARKQAAPELLTLPILAPEAAQ